jgi:8-oxo-dGTP diphosphatase
VSDPQVRAAGGVVLRLGPGRRPEVLLVHRPAHADWTLPKGKAAGDEPDEACALREVAEETGLVCSLGPELGATRYRDRHGRDKQVRYWVMTACRGAFAPNAEVDQVRWLGLAEATGQLSYEGDRALLARVDPVLRALVVLVRHARAVDPADWVGDDRTRPLDPVGWRQAAALAGAVAGYPVTRLLASPSERCIQTLEPLSACLAQPVEHAPALGEGAPAAAVRGLVARLGPGPLVLCTHGDVMQALVGPGAPCAEATAWLLRREGAALRPLRHWPPAG